jgi:DNA transformation protein
MDEFSQHCCELLSVVGAVRSRAMFGGRGIYIDDLFVALIASEQLYLKVDALTKPQFEAAGCTAFRYRKDDEWLAMGYFSAPEEAMESAALMQPWARLAVAAALRARLKKPARKGAKTSAKAG